MKLLGTILSFVIAFQCYAQKASFKELKLNPNNKYYTTNESTIVFPVVTTKNPKIDKLINDQIKIDVLHPEDKTQSLKKVLLENIKEYGLTDVSYEITYNSYNFLVIVFFRSHGNQNIFKLYPIRFTVVPIALLVAMMMSRWVLISVSVLAVWWDVYHSSLQTFGLGRIYDMRAGNDPQAGRRLDFLLNLLLYAGPIFAGAVLVDHIESFTKFSEFGDVFLTHIPAYAENNQRYMTWGVLGFGGAFLCYYLYANWRLVQQGQRISPQKVLLYAATGACSIYTWGFNTFGEAFFIMNFFHAFQYFALVWWSEKKTMLNLFHLGNIRWGKPIALVLFLVLGLGYGLWAEVSENQSTFALSVVLVVSIMHFWYDGFIWSVRKKQI